MRTELWGLRDRETHEPIYTYFASSNPHRAIFAKKKSAEMACQYPMSKRYEPFRITGYETIDPVYQAGGCYCRECKYQDFDDAYNKRWCNRDLGGHEVKTDGGGFCDRGRKKEAQDA